MLIVKLLVVVKPDMNPFLSLPATNPYDKILPSEKSLFVVMIFDQITHVTFFLLKWLLQLVLLGLISLQNSAYFYFSSKIVAL